MNSTPWPTLIGDTTLGLAAVTAEWAAGKLDVKKKKYQGKEKISIFLFASYRPGKVKWRQLINLHWSAYGHFIFVFLIFGCCCCCCCWNWIFLFGVAIHPLAFINNFIFFFKKNGWFNFTTISKFVEWIRGILIGQWMEFSLNFWFTIISLSFNGRTGSFFLWPSHSSGE